MSLEDATNHFENPKTGPPKNSVFDLLQEAEATAAAAETKAAAAAKENSSAPAKAAVAAADRARVAKTTPTNLIVVSPIADGSHGSKTISPSKQPPLPWPWGRGPTKTVALPVPSLKYEVPAPWLDELMPYGTPKHAPKLRHN